MNESRVDQFEQLVRNVTRLLRYQRERHPPFPSSTANDLKIVENRAHLRGCGTRNKCMNLFDNYEQLGAHSPGRHRLPFRCFDYAVKKRLERVRNTDVASAISCLGNVD